MPFEFYRLEIPDVVFVKARRFDDERGFFREMYKASAFAEQGIPNNFVQDNLSHSERGVLRGLHYQKAPHPQGKLVMVLRGRIYDVAVDIRRDSATFGQWVGCELTSEGGELLWVPAGFAHGFCVLSDEADVLYKVTDEYARECDRGIVWNDPEIGVEWPVDEPLLSEKDAELPLLRDAEIEF
ncbi:MAG TPA: dTDP-4-dehydrorhamnose 3,5-epimerase [Anaerolineae bacterium]|jgi:dTDP-4-dehydrorhamnose 3,5-epimerase|nr:dTDP-4-dehydrorhamnose 3,5-epimerase [Anaerolineae bacterium]